MPILESVKALLQHPEILDLYFNQTLDRNFNAECHHEINSYDDSLNFKAFELFTLNLNSIQLVFFIDGYSNCNPLGDGRNLYKTTGVYFRIGNLPRQYQSVDYFTQLALLFYDSQLKYYGYDVIMKPLIDDLKTLESTGIAIIYNNETIVLKGTISYICSDNLAGNSVGGYIESFGSNVDCKYCQINKLTLNQ